MKTIQKFAIAIAMLFLGLSSAHAQSDYLLNYGPGSISWCMQMQQQTDALRMMNAMMAQQAVNYYWQQAAAATQWMQTTPCVPMPGVVNYDGTYSTPDTVNDYHNETVPCEHCNGGYNYRTLYTVSGNRTVKTICSWCHGNGYVTKRVRNH